MKPLRLIAFLLPALNPVKSLDGEKISFYLTAKGFQLILSLFFFFLLQVWAEGSNRGGEIHKEYKFILQDITLSYN